METEVYSKKNYSQSYSIPISQIRQFCFCPRVFYYHEFMKFKTQTPLWVEQGEQYHSVASEFMKRRTLNRFGLKDAKLLRRVELKNNQLGIHGVADGLLIGSDQVSVLEYKLAGKKPSTGQILQAVAYGMCAAEQWQMPFRTAFLLFGRNPRPHVVHITEDLVDKLNRTVAKMHSVVDAGFLPDSSASDYQCGQCEFLNYCNDRGI